MAVKVGDGVSIATGGWVVTDSGGDVTPPGQAGVFQLGGVTTTTATFNITPPTDADYDHVDLSLTVEGSGEDEVHENFDGQLTGLSPGTWYLATVCAFDTSGNRGRPSPALRFVTVQAAEGEHNFRVKFKTDEAPSWEVLQDCDITKDRHRVPTMLRGEQGQMEIEFCEVGHSVEFIGYILKAAVTGRRAD